MIEVSRLARGTAGTTVGGVVTALAAFGSVAAVARALGPAAAGVFGVCVALVTILTQAGKLGCDTALVHTLPRWSRDPALREDRARLLGGCLLAVGALGVVAGALTWWAADPIARLLLDGAPGGPAADAVRATAAGLPPAVVTAVALAGTRGLGTVRPLVLNDLIAKPGLRLAGVVTVLVAGGDVVDVLVVWSVVAWLLLPWSLRALHRGLGTSPRPWRRPLGERHRRGFVRFAGLRSASASVEVVGLNAGLLLVGVLLGATEAGLYTVSMRLVLAGFLTLQAVRLAVAPQLSAALADDSPRRARALHHASSGWVVLTAWPIYLVLLVLAPEVLGVFGAGFADAGTALRILAIGGLVSVAAGNVQTVLLMGGLAGAYLGVAVASVAAQVTAIVVLAPRYGVEGAAAGFLVACLVENGLAMLAVHRRLGVPPVGRPVVVAAAVTVATVGTGAVAARLVGPGLGGGLGPMLLVLALAGPAYVAACWRVRSALVLDAVAEGLPFRRPPRPPAVAAAHVPQETR